MGKQTFKERVAQIANEQAIHYQNNYVKYEYLLCSEAFINQDYYIISAKEDNYCHLIGVNTDLSPKAFFDKCLESSLTESDFDFLKSGRDEKEVKGSVRRKIKALPFFTSMMGKDLIVQENFTKNAISCIFASTDCNITIGFANPDRSRPMTLLWNDELNYNKSGFVDLILRKESGNEDFTDIIYGDVEALKKFHTKIKHLISPELSNNI